MTHQHHLAEVLTADRCTCGDTVRGCEAKRVELRRQRSLRTTEDRMMDSENRARRYRSTGR
jgi:hypothetical protein